MSEKRSIMKVLKDATGQALSLSKVSLGDTLDAAIRGIAVFGFRDSDGNAIAPQLDSLKRLPVTFDAGTCVPFIGEEVEANLTEDTEALIATINLNSGEEYVNTEVIMSSAREFDYRVANVDDAGGAPVETNIAKGFMGDGDLHKNVMPSKHCFTAGTTGTQELRIYATPRDADPCDIFAHGSINEVS